MQLLRVSENKRFLMQEDGTPFFWLGDTAWELFHRLTIEESEVYLENRAQKGFNVVQAVALSEFDGVRTENAYGRIPLKIDENGCYDPAQPDDDGEYSYWAHMDKIIELACRKGIYVALLPTWGDKYNPGVWGKGPDIFNGENAYKFAIWIGNRYKDSKNVIWVLGGDRELAERRHFDVINNMAKGLKETCYQLITFHPYGGSSSSKHNHFETWLDFNMIQSGHAEEYMNQDNYVTKDYLLEPVKPVSDAESRYEDHPMNFRGNNTMFDAFISRVAAYQSVFAGGFGYTYGHHAIWGFKPESERDNYFANNWIVAMDRPGACQMQHLKNLMLSNSYFDRIPDSSFICDRYENASKLYGTRGHDYLMVYSPLGYRVTLNMGVIDGKRVKASWYCPKTGSYQFIGEYDNTGKCSFIPKVSGRGEDVVLVIEKI